MSPNRIRTVALVPLGLLAASIALAACGDSSSPSGAAASAADNALAFSRCMREHGVKDFPNPETGPGGVTKLSFKAEGTNPKAMEAAQKACQHFQEEGGPGGKELSPQQKVEAEENVQKFAKCMREHGIEVQTQVGNGNIGIRIGGPGAGGPNPKSPAFQQAQEACQSLMPGPKGGPGGPTTSVHGKEAPGGGAGLSMESGPSEE
jgi:hypothetical protein